MGEKTSKERFMDAAKKFQYRIPVRMKGDREKKGYIEVFKGTCGKSSIHYPWTFYRSSEPIKYLWLMVHWDDGEVEFEKAVELDIKDEEKRERP